MMHQKRVHEIRQMIDAAVLQSIREGKGSEEERKQAVKHFMETALALEELKDFMAMTSVERWTDNLREEGMVRIGDGGSIDTTSKYDPDKAGDMLADAIGLPPDDEDDDEGEEWKN